MDGSLLPGPYFNNVIVHMELQMCSHLMLGVKNYREGSKTLDMFDME